jgi:hypothetical protein
MPQTAENQRIMELCASIRESARELAKRPDFYELVSDCKTCYDGELLLDGERCSDCGEYKGDARVEPRTGAFRRGWIP